MSRRSTELARKVRQHTVQRDQQVRDTSKSSNAPWKTRKSADSAVAALTPRNAGDGFRQRLARAVRGNA